MTFLCAGFNQALKKGYWVLLDELNLAPQSVLEVVFVLVFIINLRITFDLLFSYSRPLFAPIVCEVLTTTYFSYFRV